MSVVSTMGCAASALLGGIGDRKTASLQTEVCGNFQLKRHTQD